MPSTNYHKFNHLLTDPNEQILNTLANSAAEAFASTGKVKKGFAILTNQRVYFKGKCLMRSERGSKHKKKAYAVDLQDITATSVVNTRSLPFHIIAKILALFAVIITIWEIYHLVLGIMGGYILLNIVISWLLALVFALFDRWLTCRLFKISFAGGSIAFPLPWISPAEANAFRETLLQACGTELKS